MYDTSEIQIRARALPRNFYMRESRDLIRGYRLKRISLLLW